MAGQHVKGIDLEVALVAVGSTNPVKLAAVEATIPMLWPTARIVAVAVDSGVPAQPKSDQEMVNGARIRAEAARRALDADLGIGLEGGVHPSPWGCLLSGWVAIIDRQGRLGLGSAGRIVLPPPLAEALTQGAELGPVMDSLTGQHETRKGPGTVGILTAGLVQREESFRTGVACALAPFLHPAWYDPA